MKYFSQIPLLDKVTVAIPSSYDASEYPFNLNLIKNLYEITFPTQVTFFVGENGTGKSTILEAIAYHAGFGPEGGSKNISFKTSVEDTYSGVRELSDHLTLSWRLKPRERLFF